MSKQLNFSVDQDTVNLIAALKVAFAATSSAEVIRKALAIARVCADQQLDDGTVVIEGKRPIRIVLNA